MDDLDRLLAETMRDAAERAPADDGLLGKVHRRSDRRRRRRIAAGLSALAAVLAVGAPVAVVRMERTSPPPSPAGPSPAVVLVDGYEPPAFPYTLPADAGLRDPVARVEGGRLVALFEATEQRHHADVTVTVSDREPRFAGPGSDTSVRLRGHPGVLRTVDRQPAKQLTVWWRESPSRWIELATDDTYSQQQVLHLAGSLSAAVVPVLPPFRLDLSPAGFVTDTVTESTMSFRRGAGAPDSEELRVVLRKRRPPASSDLTVGRYRAQLTRRAGAATLDVDVTDWDATLEVTAGAGLAMTEDDLLRFAAGVHILNRSNPE
jgi:hypothetical protein